MKNFLKLISISILITFTISCSDKASSIKSQNSNSTHIGNNLKEETINKKEIILSDTQEIQPIDSSLDTTNDNKLDSVNYLNNNQFKEIDLLFKKIAKIEFDTLKAKYEISCPLNSGHFIKGSGITVDSYCNEICETYLKDSTGRTLFMPTSFDAGILNMSLSPSCTQLLICSSYDDTDYDSYYYHRAEIFIFNIISGKGIEGVVPSNLFTTKEWSFDDIV